MRQEMCCERGRSERRERRDAIIGVGEPAAEEIVSQSDPHEAFVQHFIYGQLNSSYTSTRVLLFS